MEPGGKAASASRASRRSMWTERSHGCHRVTVPELAEPAAKPRLPDRGGCGSARRTSAPPEPGPASARAASRGVRGGVRGRLAGRGGGGGSGGTPTWGRRSFAVLARASTRAPRVEARIRRGAASLRGLSRGRFRPKRPDFAPFHAQTCNRVFFRPNRDSWASGGLPCPALRAQPPPRRGSSFGRWPAVHLWPPSAWPRTSSGATARSTPSTSTR